MNRTISIATASQKSSVKKTKSCIYNFETGVMGWKHQTYKDSRAIHSVIQSQKGVAKYGNYSLEALVNLICGDKSLSKGETFVEIASDTLIGAYGPKNLLGKPISCWIKTPWKAVGEWSKPNGIQVFVKDMKNRSQYGEWHNIETDKWFEVIYTPTLKPTKGMWTDKGFDPTKITIIGVKIGCGGGSSARFKGKINIDCISL